MKRPPTSDIVTIVMFVATLVGFSGWSFANIQLADQKPPVLSTRASVLRSYPHRFEQYFNGHLAFRPTLIHVNAWIKSKLFKASPNPKVIIGRRGWLFYDHTLDPGGMRHDDPGLPPRIERAVTAFNLRRQWCEQRGIRYFVLVTPDKQTIYPELLPARARAKGMTALDRFVDGCRATPLAVVDLREPLLAAKPTGRLYYKTDTHWNVRASHFGYSAAVNQLARWFPSVGAPKPQWTVSFRKRALLDLARMMGCGEWNMENIDELMSFDAFQAEVTTEPVSIHPSLFLDHQTPRVLIRRDQPHLPKVVMFDDSFSQVLLYQRIAEHCSRLVHAPSYGFDEKLIERERPDVVIDQFVERRLQMSEWRRPGEKPYQ